ncbi:MAG: SNF2-related protein, partial [Clostridium paraputrificum]
TIEALVMLKGLKKDNEKILLIIPEALVNQWQHELDSKLWMESVIYNGSNLNSSDIVIVPVEMVAVVSAEKLINIFDYCVIDEVHRIIGENQLYDKMLYICKNIKNVLLLSATPIQNRKEEYLQLLKLLNPEKYEYMTEREFTELFDKNSNIRRLVYRVYRDLPSAYGEDIDMDEVEEIYECIEDIKYELEDKCLNKIFDEIDIYSGDNGEEKIREILAYISITYQFEKNIIRHRREELKDMLPKRAQDSIFYVMKSASDNYYENECYEKVVQYIENLKSNNQWTEELGEYVRVILNSMFSSPWALNYVLETRKSALKKAIRTKFNYVTVAYSQRKERERIHRIISSIHTFTEEKKLLDEVIFYLRKWTVAAERELENIDELMDNPDNIKGRLGKVIDYLEQELYEDKVVIFSSWVETLEKLRSMLVKLYGE